MARTTPDRAHRNCWRYRLLNPEAFGMSAPNHRATTAAIVQANSASDPCNPRRVSPLSVRVPLPDRVVPHPATNADSQPAAEGPAEVECPDAMTDRWAEPGGTRSTRRCAAHLCSGCPFVQRY